MANTEVRRYGWDGKYKYSDYYDGNQKVGSSIDRYGYDGQYRGTDHYDVHNNKTGYSKNGPHDD